MMKRNVIPILVSLILGLVAISVKAAEVLTPGFLKISIYTNIVGVSVADLTADPNYPSKPSEIRYLRSFNTRDALPTDVLEDFGARIEGFLTPQESGDYYFFLRSDKQSELWLSLDDKEANSMVIASESDNGDPFMEPDTFDTATSQSINLVAGKRYFIMVLYKGSTGGGNTSDYSQVAWRKVGETNPPAFLLKPIPGAFLSTMASADPSAKVTITQSPANVSSEENSKATFTVTADTFPATYVSIQWQRNGVNIPGAVGGSYSRYLDKTDNNARFQAVVAVPGSFTTSAEATVTVTDDKTRPTLLSAKGGPNRPQVILTYSERLNQASATSLSNYKIASPSGASLGVSSATLSEDRTVVTLTTDTQTPGTQYTVTVNNVTDLAAAASPNTIAANTQASFYAMGPWLQGDDGFVVWEAENYDRNLDGLWFADSERGVASGGIAMVNYNGAGGDEANTKIEYDILFTKTGTHILWYRNSANDGNDDSIWVHLDGIRPVEREAGNLAAASGFTSGLQSAYGWGSSAYEGGGRMTVNIEKPGLHTISIARREDGAYVDKLLITTDQNFSPTTGFTTFGPAVTLRQGEPPSATADFSITTHPVNTQGPQNGSITLTGAATIPTGVLYSYQWQRKHGGAFVDIVGQTSASMTLSPLSADWDGAIVRLRVIVGGVAKFSNEATISVLIDNIPPTVRMSILPRITITPDQIILIFSEVVSKATAENTANYSVAATAGSVSVQSAVLADDGRTVTLTTAAQTAGRLYTVTINNVTDLATKPNPIAPNTQVAFFYAGVSDKFAQRADGYVIMEAENATRISAASDGDEWERRTAATGFSGLGYMVVPNGKSGGNVGTGAHLEYDIVFKQTGTYSVWIRAWNENIANAGADDSVYVGFDGVGVGTGNDASLAGFPATGWMWRSDRQTGTDPVTIEVTTAGIHILDLWHREDGTLIDKIIIEPGSRGSGTSAPTPTTANSGRGEGDTWNFAVAPPQAPTISMTNPQDGQTFAAGSTIDITADIVAPSPLTRVEFLDGTNVVGQVITAPYKVTIPNIKEGIYSISAQVTDQLGYNVSTPAARVVVDSTKPVMQAVAANFDGSIIGVLFKESISGLDPSTAGDLANFQINNGTVAITSAVLQPDNVTVVLIPATPVTGQFSVKAQNIADRGHGPNVMEPATLSGTVIRDSFKAQDVGTINTNDPAVFSDPVKPGFALAINPTDYYIAAGGSDIWNLADGCHFLYQEKSGDFDVAVQIESLTRPNEWSKATLMVREDLDGGSRNYLALVAPPAIGNPAGMNLFNAQWRDVKGGTTETLAATERPSPVPYPNAWLRLTRVGNDMKTYHGTNGTDWILLNSYTPPTPYPSKTYVGVAVTSHNNGSSEANTVRAVIRNLKGFGAPVTPIISPSLTIKKVSSNVEISWTSDSNKFVLQSTISLSIKNWQPVPIAATVSGNVYKVVAPIGGSTQFYRVVAQ